MRGSTATYSVTAQPSGGFADTVSLSVSGVPNGATGSFSPATIDTATANSGSTLSVTTTSAVAPGTYTLTISATNGAITRTTTVTFIVQLPPVVLTASPSSVAGGAAVTVAWSNVNSPNRNNWVGLYAAGAANNAYLGGFYDDNCGQSAGTSAVASGSCSFTMPNSNGTFEFRLFASKAATLLATSNAVTVTVAKANPALSTQASAGIKLGASVKDTAKLTLGNAPKGTITFSLFGPTDTNCSATPVTTSTVAVNGNGSYSSPQYKPTQTGTYHWVAVYSGDANNNPASGACGIWASRSRSRRRGGGVAAAAAWWLGSLVI